MRQTMVRQASDNRYLHPDFHGALNTGLLYLAETFGDAAVSEYLEQFARRFYAPLTQQINERGLVALKEHFERIYGDEGAEVAIRLSDDELEVRVDACPAVTHLRARGDRISPLFVETTRAVNAAICAGTPYAAALDDYDPQTGRSVMRFTPRKP